MPIYCYSTEEGDSFEVNFKMGDAPEKIHMSRGGFAWRDRNAEHVGQIAIVKGTSNPVKRPWPQRCCASGVHVDDGPELAKHLRDRGCPTEVVGGDPVYTSAAHKRKALKIRGFVDKNSFC